MNKKVTLKKVRVTISLDEKLIWILRHKQAEMMLDNNKQVTISAVVNSLLNQVIKNEKKTNSQLDLVFSHNNLV